MQGHRISIRRNVLYLLAGQAAIAVSGLILNVLIARALDKEIFGAFVYAIAFASLFLPVHDLGIASYYLARGARNRENIGIYFARVLMTRAFLAPLASLLLCLVYYLVEGRFDYFLLILIFYLLGQSLLLLTDIVFVGHEAARSWTTRRIAYEAARIILISVAIYGFGIDDAGTLVALAAAGSVVGIVWAFVSVWRLCDMSGRTWVEAWRGLIRTTELPVILPYTGQYFLTVMHSRLSVFLLGLLASETEVADYRVCFAVVVMLLYIPRGLAQAVTPRLGLYDEKRQSQDFKALLERAGGLILFIAALFLVGGTFIGAEAIGFVFGPQYEGLHTLWILLCVVVALNTIEAFVNPLMNYLQLAAANVRIHAVGMAVQTAICAGLAAEVGARGVAIGMIAGAFVFVVLKLRFFAKHAGHALFSKKALWRVAAFVVIALPVQWLVRELPLPFQLGVYPPIVVALAWALKLLPDEVLSGVRVITRRVVGLGLDQ